MMDFQSQFLSWLQHYGIFGIYGLLALGIVGLPIPDETLLILTGLFCAKGHLNILSAYPAALSGSITGITLSYFIGFLAGQNLLKRYGYLIGLTEQKIKKSHEWFEYYGKWLLVIGYYIPGVRHFTGIISGSVYLNYFKFALFAYSGAFIWSLTFFSIGYYFYDIWQKIHLNWLLS